MAGVSVPNAQSVANQVNGIVASQKNSPNGLAGLNASSEFVGTIISRAGTDDEIQLTIPKLNELVFTTDTNEIRRGDGVTPGGVFVSGREAAQSVFINSLPDLTSPNTTSLSLKSGRAYSVRLEFRFGNDTDNLSNWNMSFTRTGLLAGHLHDPSGTNAAVTATLRAEWYYSVPSVASSLILLAGSTTAGTAGPSQVVLDRPSGVFIAEYRIGVFQGGSLNINISKRTSGAAAVFAQGVISVRRIL